MQLEKIIMIGVTQTQEGKHYIISNKKVLVFTAKYQGKQEC